jgi:iron complex outermembrane recepter protein
MLSVPCLLPFSRFSRLMSGVILCLCILPGALVHADAETFQFSIKKQPLPQALSEFSIQSRLQVTVPSDLVNGKPGQTVQGNLTAEAALQNLLAGTGLKAEPSGSKSFVISKLATKVVDDSPLVEQITVMGIKLESGLQDTKESIAVLTSKTIEERGLIDIGDALAQTAGVSGNERSFRIRGIDSGPTGTLRSELASYYVDGVALSGWTKSEGPKQLWDVDQVEIMRGPQSTNLGRNSLAGAIVVRTKDPVYDNTAAIRTGFGSAGKRELSGMGNLSLVEGLSAIRVSFEQTETDGHTDNITLSKDDFSFDDRKSINFKWLLEPTDNLKMTLAVLYADNKYGDTTVAFEGAGQKQKDRHALADVRGHYEQKSTQASLTIDYQINDTWSFKSITAGMDGKRDRIDDFDNTAASLEAGSGGVVVRDAEDKNFSQEFRFNFDGDEIRGSSGFYYGKIEAENNNDTNTFLNLEDLINGFNPGLGSLLVGFNVYPQLFDLETGGTNEIETTNYAVFSEWEINFAEKWTLSFGARYDREDQDIGFINKSSSSVVLPNSADWAFLGAPVVGAIDLINSQLVPFTADGPRFDSGSDYDAFLPHVGISYDWNEDVSTSFFVKRGYRSGGTEITSLNIINPYDPEYLLNYELALRALLFEGRGVLNSNIYYGDWKDQQVSIPEIPGGSDAFLKIDNAGESEIAGIEVDFNYRINNQLSVFTSAAYSHTEFKDFISGSEDFSGNEFHFAPKVTGALGVNYTALNGLFVNTNLTYQGRSYADSANEKELDAHTLVNLRAGFQNDTVRVEFYSTNLFDEDYATSKFQDFGRMGTPREYGMRLTYQL